MKLLRVDFEPMLHRPLETTPFLGTWPSYVRVNGARSDGRSVLSMPLWQASTSPDSFTNRREPLGKRTLESSAPAELIGGGEYIEFRTDRGVRPS